MTRTAPLAPTVALDFAVPDDLIERDQWVVWGRQHETKVPYSTRGYKASSTEPRDWASYETALAAWQANPQRYAGIGFVFTKSDPFAGIDLDDCLNSEGGVKPWARGVVERFADSYCEISPSGGGLKIWVYGALPANVPKVLVGDGGIELYDHARYFAVTGRAFRGAPLDVEHHEEDLLLLYDRLTQARGKGRWPLQPLEGGRIPHGRQHSTLVSICGTLRVRGVCSQAIEACLLAINEHQCERPGPRENITRIVRSTRDWGIA
jgi:hypothetical protein